MAINTLTNSYLTRLSVANHDGVTQQICDRLVAFVTDNQMLIAARGEVVTTPEVEAIPATRTTPGTRIKFFV